MSDGKTGPSWLYYVLAGLVFVCGQGLSVAYIIYGVLQSGEGIQRVVVPGTHTLEFAEAGNYTIFHEYRSMVDGTVYQTSGPLGPLKCSLQSADGKQTVSVTPARMNSSYTMGSYAGQSLWDFRVNSPGTHQLTAQYADGAAQPAVVLSIHRGFFRGLMQTILLVMAVSIGSFGLCVVIVVVTYSKRRNARRRQDTYPVVPVARRTGV